MFNNGLLGSSYRFWAFVLPTLCVQVVVLAGMCMKLGPSARSRKTFQMAGLGTSENDLGQVRDGKELHWTLRCIPFLGLLWSTG